MVHSQALCRLAKTCEPLVGPTLPPLQRIIACPSFFLSETEGGELKEGRNPAKGEGCDKRSEKKNAGETIRAELACNCGGPASCRG